MTRPARIDAIDKAMGRTVFVDDLREAGRSRLALTVTSRIAKGRVGAVRAEAALAVPGVVQVMTHANAPRLRRILAASMAEIGALRPLPDDRIHFYGQPVAVMIAENWRAAREGAARLQVDEIADATPIAARLARVRQAGIVPGRLRKGKALQDILQAPQVIDKEFHTAPHRHNAIEPGAVIARWDADSNVTVPAATHWHHIDMMAIGQAFGLGADSGLSGFLARMFPGRARPMRVRLVNHPSGGAFGRNLNTIPMILACMAARVAGRAVKPAVTREQTFSFLSHRGEVRQRLRIGAPPPDGRVGPILQEPDVAQGAGGQFVEPAGEVSMQIYAHQTHLMQHRVARLDQSRTGWMRAPGISASSFALESAVDEPAHALGLDPLEIRLRNHAAVNTQSDKPWTSKGLLDCFKKGTGMFG